MADMRITASAAFPLFTERLMIREFADADASLMADWALDKAYYKYLHIGVLDQARLQDMVTTAAVQRRRDQRQLYDLAVVDKSDGSLVGTVRLAATDPYHREGLVGYGISPARWGEGLATEAMAPVVQFAFLALGLNRLNAICDIDHVASHRVAEKLGFVREGVLRRHRRVVLDDGSDLWRDTALYALLADDAGI